MYPESIAEKYLPKANKFKGANIFEDLFNNLDYKKTTDERAVFIDGSMLVYRSKKWYLEYLDEDEDI